MEIYVESMLRLLSCHHHHRHQLKVRHLPTPRRHPPPAIGAAAS